MPLPFKSTIVPATLDDVKYGRKIVPYTTERMIRPAGMGDLITAATSALHIPQCGGCKKRAAALNRMFPFNKPPCPNCGKKG